MKALAFVSALALLASGPADVSKSSSPVADAVQAGDRESARSLLKDGADVNAAQGDGMTALHWAALSNDVETAEMLLYAGANVKAATRLGAQTPLILACRNGNAAVVETLLNGGADPNLPTGTGATPLMLAAGSGNASAVRALLARGAAVNARESLRGETALMFAAAANRAEVVDILMTGGADQSLTTTLIDAPALTKTSDEAFKKRIDALREERAKKGGQEEAKPPEAESSKEKGEGSVLGKVFGWMK
ncbi:MAG TPA: ankyrin repeat domain-containing protein, partial [Vicinamibacteria bacterium]|nr:ankyrin repeat domain-containing protein [Vicinamibacteria bacterium]